MIVGFLALGATAEAVLVSLDVNPPNGQASRTVTLGTPFTVDIVVSDVTDLIGFTIDLGFDASVLTATGGSIGTFLGGGLLLFPPDLTPPDVNLVGGTFIGVGTTGSGVLASINFTAVGPGVNSPLDFNLVQLTDSLGGKILDFPVIPGSEDSVSNGSITVVPIPGAALLFGTGLIGLIAIARRKALRTQN